MPKKNDTFQKVKAVILMIDMVDSTIIKRNYADTPQMWVEAFSNFFSITSKRVLELKGNVVKYIGDEVLIVFSENKFKEATQFISEFKDYCKCINKEQNIQLQFKMAVDFGELYQIHIGTTVDYLGNSLDRCARISKLLKPNVVLCSKEFKNKYINEKDDKKLDDITFSQGESIRLKDLDEGELYQLFYENISYNLASYSAKNKFEGNLDEIINTLIFNEKERTYEFFRQIICYNQGMYLQYLFQVADKHKQLRMAVDNKKNSISEDFENLNVLAYDLNSYWLYNYRFLIDAMQNRSAILPRITLKCWTDKNNIQTMFIDNLNRIVDKPENYKLNFGYVSIVKNGLYYLENNLPEAASKSKNGYFNPKLDKERVKKYFETVKNRKKETKSNFDSIRDFNYDHEWMKCWKNKSDPRFCYKSVLIIPITLRNNVLKDNNEKIYSKTKGTMDIDKDITNKFPKKEIFGILTMDHHTKGFFKQSDVYLGYVIADTLCYYLMTMVNFTERSNIWGQANKMINKSKKIKKSE